jgi:hypothetical protein
VPSKVAAPAGRSTEEPSEREFLRVCGHASVRPKALTAPSGAWQDQQASDQREVDGVKKVVSLSGGTTRRTPGVLVLGAVVSLFLALSGHASARSCSPVVNPYPGTRYEGINISHIRAEGIGCPRARKVAKRAHRKALGITPPPNGIRRFQWNGWRVVGDLRPSSDKYQATRVGQRVLWRF